MTTENAMTDDPFDLGGFRGRSRMWGQPSSTLTDMLLCEPGSRVEGTTEDVLRAVFEASWYLFRETMTDDAADRLALALLGRIHDQLAQEGHIVRVYPGKD